MIKRIDVSITPDGVFDNPMMRVQIAQDGHKIGHDQILPVELDPYIFEHIMKRVTAELKEALFNEAV